VKKVEQQLITGIQNTDHNKLQEVRNNTNNGTANFTLSQRGEFQKWITKTVQENKKMAEENTKSDDNESLDDDKVNHKDISDGFDRHDIEMEKQAKLLDRLRYEALMFRDK
jgi:hypothetical protein